MPGRGGTNMVIKYALPYHPTSSNESNSFVMVGMAVTSTALSYASQLELGTTQETTYQGNEQHRQRQPDQYQHQLDAHNMMSTLIILSSWGSRVLARFGPRVLFCGRRRRARL